MRVDGGVPDSVRSRTGFCECGCGERTPIATANDPQKGRYKGYPSRWINNGHKSRAKDAPPEVRARSGFCECGCGERTSVARQSLISRGDYAGWPLRFRVGHATRAAAPDEVKQRDGFCECDCGERTAIARQSVLSRGQYAGYPNRFVHGHGGRPSTRRRSNTAYNSGRYRVLWRPEHPNADATGAVLEHRFVMSEMLGRALLPAETVHHINGDRRDNRPENLQLRQGNHGMGVRMQCHTCGGHDVGPVALGE